MRRARGRRRGARVPGRALGRRRAHRAERARARAPDRAATARSRSPHAEDALQRKALLYDKGGDQHYDYISAWIKATRGSDPDASLYYLAVDARGRRGPALHRPPHGHPRLRGHRQRRPAGAPGGGRRRGRASSTSGCPSAQFALAQAAIYLSLAPKSNAAERAIGAARGHIREHGAAAAARATCARRPTRARGSSAAAWATTTRTTTRARSTTRSSCPRALEDARFYEPDDARARSCASAWRRSGAARRGRVRRSTPAFGKPASGCEPDRDRIDPGALLRSSRSPAGPRVRLRLRGRSDAPRSARCSLAARPVRTTSSSQRLLRFDPARRLPSPRSLRARGEALRRRRARSTSPPATSRTSRGRRAPRARRSSAGRGCSSEPAPPRGLASPSAPSGARDGDPAAGPGRAAGPRSS